MTLTKVTYSLINGAPVNVLDFGAVGDGVTDDTAAIQAAHDSLPANGGTIDFPMDGLYLLSTTAVYVNISKPNVTIRGSSGAWVVNPASDNAEVTTGSSILNGFRFTGNNCTLSINMRGCANIWTPQTASDNFSMRNMKMLNLYNAGISINNTPFDTLDIDGVEFNTSRDLASDAGNYEAISRSCNGNTANYGKLIRVMRSTFKGVSGGIDAHNVKDLVVGGGTRFEGCDVDCIKLATLDSVFVKQNLTVDKTVTFDGAAINPASANRHLSATGLGRTVPNYSAYLGFIQIWDKLDFSGKSYNFANGSIGMTGTNTVGVINLSGAEFRNDSYNATGYAIIGSSGTLNITNGSVFYNAPVSSSSQDWCRRININHSKFTDSYISISKKSIATGDCFDVLDNDISYGVDANGSVRFINNGVDVTAPTLIVDRNKITLTGGQTVSADMSSSGTVGVFGNMNQLATTYTVTGGLSPTTYEEFTTAGTHSLYMYKLNNGQITITNTGSAGNIGYGIKDSDMAGSSGFVPVGTIINGVQTHATNALYFTTAANKMNGPGNAGKTTVTSASVGAAITIKKTAADTWMVTSQVGTWNYT